MSTKLKKKNIEFTSRKLMASALLLLAVAALGACSTQLAESTPTGTSETVTVPAADKEIDPRAFERDTLKELGMPSEIVMRHRYFLPVPNRVKVILSRRATPLFPVSCYMKPSRVYHPSSV